MHSEIEGVGETGGASPSGAGLKVRKETETTLWMEVVKILVRQYWEGRSPVRM